MGASRPGARAAPAFPLVDAGMRQLRREGWMHNRARLVVGSFLTKDLGIDWRWGERWFMRLLVDGDEANNNGNWQWIASVGTDPQPAFRRIYNPARHMERHDPSGDYVRRYVPELRAVPDEHLAEPWPMPEEVQREAGCVIGQRLSGADRGPRRGAPRGAGALPGLVPLNRLERYVRRRWQLDRDRVAGADLAGGQHDRHDADLSDEAALLVAVEHGLHQSLVDPLELYARIAQAGDLDHRVATERQLRARRQGEQLEPTGGHVLAHLPGLDRKAALPELVVQLLVDEVDLTEVGPWHSAVHIVLHADAGEQPDRVLVQLAHVVLGPAAHGGHDHGTSHLSSEASGRAQASPSRVDTGRMSIDVKNGQPDSEEITLTLELTLDEAEALKAWLLKPAADGSAAIDDGNAKSVMVQLGSKLDYISGVTQVRDELEEAGFDTEDLSDEQIADLGRRIADTPIRRYQGKQD